MPLILSFMNGPNGVICQQARSSNDKLTAAVEKLTEEYIAPFLFIPEPAPIATPPNVANDSLDFADSVLAQFLERFNNILNAKDEDGVPF